MKPVKCYDDLDYIRGKDARHIRILLEHEQVRTRLKDNNVENTVVIFGSARTLPPLDLTSKAEDAHFSKAKELKKQLAQSRYYEECLDLSGASFDGLTGTRQTCISALAADQASWRRQTRGRF
jgi:hypothetical protein